MKRVLSIALAVTMAVSLAACGGGGSTATTAAAAESGSGASTETKAASGKTIKLKMSSTVGEQSNAVVVAKAFADDVKEKSGGAIEISVYASDQLSGGDMAKGVENLQNGAIDCAFEPVDVMSNLDQTMLALSLPWTFDSYQAAAENLKGDGGAYITKCLDAQGIHTLGFIHNGFRQLTNSKRPVTTPDDIKAMKLRVPGGDVFMKFFKALGADPVAMSFSELFTALQQGTVDGQENGFDLITTNKFYEVQKYFTEVNYQFHPDPFYVNAAWWNSLPAEYQTAIQEAATDMGEYNDQLIDENSEKAKQQIIDSGAEVYTPTADELQAFKDAVKPVWDQAVTEGICTKEEVDEMVSIVDAAK